MSTETKKYGVQAGPITFGTLNSRNQLVIKVLNPALDELLALPAYEHVTDSQTTYRIKIMLVSEREIEDELEAAPGVPLMQ
jgi:hypothetical protein